MQMKGSRLVFGLLFGIVQLFSDFILPGIAGEVTITWNPNSESDLAGYSVYRGTGSSGSPYILIGDLLLDELSDPEHPETKITGLEEDTNYHIAVTAYDEAGNESYYSKEICVKINNSVIIDCSPAVDSSGGSGAGGSGGCSILSSAGKFRSY